MQDDLTDTTTKESSELAEQTTKPHFFNEEKFQLLRHYQQAIFNATEVSPNLRKMVNELITIENLEKVKMKFITVYQSLNS